MYCKISINTCLTPSHVRQSIRSDKIMVWCTILVPGLTLDGFELKQLMLMLIHNTAFRSDLIILIYIVLTTRLCFDPNLFHVTMSTQQRSDFYATNMIYLNVLQTRPIEISWTLLARKVYDNERRPKIEVK